MNKKITTRKTPALQGEARVPGDKSISHRSVMFSSLADGKSEIRGFLDGHDCRATVGVMRGLGVQVEVASDGTSLTVHGAGFDGLREPAGVLDCQNSGTTMRLMAGILAGQPFNSFLVGTPQLQGRPMGRIVQPLRAMGARIVGRAGGSLAPLAFEGRELNGFRYHLPVASAQVKSCVLLAGMRGTGTTVAVEPGPARDHTERLLGAMGAPITVDGPAISIRRPEKPLWPLDLTVPGDISSAAFPLVAASIVEGSDILLQGVGINPTRTGILEGLRALGADIVTHNERESAGEPLADLQVRHIGLSGTTFEGDVIVRMIDEIPILAVAATQAEGETVIRDAQELRVKETDRIAVTVSELQKLGADIEGTPDGMVVRGPTRLKGATVSSHGDHRIAMAMAVAGLVADGETVVEDGHVFEDSFPGFDTCLRGLGASLGTR